MVSVGGGGAELGVPIADALVTHREELARAAPFGMYPDVIRSKPLRRLSRRSTACRSALLTDGDVLALLGTSPVSSANVAERRSAMHGGARVGRRAKII